MPSVDHAVIAAAGFGSRLGRGHPKCLVEFRSRTLLDRQLELLADVPDVRIVVGFQEELVVEHALALRADVTIVRNPAYASTTTLISYEMGARHLASPCLFMDADIVFERESFRRFVARAAEAEGPLVGYTDAKTADAVYVSVVGNAVTGFSRADVTPYEWANLAYLPAHYCEGGNGSVYAHLSKDLPLMGAHIVSHEIDRIEDLDYALTHHPLEGVERQGEAAQRIVESAVVRLARS
ncbi:NTP transferase domain-containing protein [Mobilicoccus pelagius]|uniref:MobA-like NTP transferase domain-containing protein n=1 Tax=Mobilicoccus pelagius NBRC 104925 TaxID=1089455 RepID=H5UQW1_9MICO|nr:NTP transferase domain-containing protein [Mobilicoccus pelagius]GAB48119.1 hypothetical protein MOPEL_060_00360 [Mobilicoccus pelagius NBRC 104925]